MNFFRKILHLFGTSKSLFFFLLIIFTISSLVEVVGIGLLGTYVSYIINPENFLIEKISKFLEFFNYDKDVINFEIFSYIIVFIFIIKFLVKIAIDLYLEYFTLSRSRLLRDKLLEKYINLKNRNLYSENTSAYVETILRLTERIQGPCMSSLLKIFSDGIILLSIIIFLFTINLYITLVCLITVFIFSFPFVFILHPKLRKFSEHQSIASKKIVKNLYELLEGLFELGIYNKISFFSENFKKQSSKMFVNTFKSNFIFFFVRPAIELVFILLIVFTLLYLTSQNVNLTENFTIISIFTISLLRIIPITTAIVSSINRLSSSKYAVEKVYDDLTLKENYLEKNATQIKEIKFEFLNIENVHFEYKNKSIFENLNLQIPKNSVTALYGKSGSGKSTLIKLISGILKPSMGEIKINNKIDIHENINIWQNKISYIPQDIFVFEDSIGKNIALSENYEEKEIHDCLKKVGLLEFAGEKISNKILQYGSNLSGGQKQRIAIARSLFFKRDILILDEITNQLDKINENKIFELVKSFKDNKTIIFISHNEKLLDFADKVVDVEKIVKS